MGIITSLVSSFGAGFFAPIGALCVLPLYPGFLAYLAGQTQNENQNRSILNMGLMVTVGVVVSMTLFGLIFTQFLQESLTRAIGIVSPIAFGVLALVSILLIMNFDLGKLFPRIQSPTTKNPYLTSFLFGLFFGAIVLPCNPASLVVLFALSTSTISFLTNFLNFVLFGLGMAFPLLLFAIISSAKSGEVIGFLVKHKKVINVTAGLIMLFISLYYLIFVFNIFGFLNNQNEFNEQTQAIEINREIKVTQNGVKYLVDPDKIVSGGPPKDGIPSIDNPKFVSTEEADEWIGDDELVLAMIYQNEKRVYPLQIMVWHEIVNDYVANNPIAVTYCPLCGSGIAYERIIMGEEVEFGTSGKLYNSNLVMYDRKTDSYWTQIDGLAIVGELTGLELKPISVDTVVWRDWKVAHPDSMILSQDTGFDRLYGEDPYGNYYENSFLFFPVENESDRIHAKTVVFGIEIDNVFKAYKEDDLKKLGSILDNINGVDIKIERSKEGIVKITNLNTGKEIVKERDFWFAWYAFHPSTELFQLTK